jgi:hypothetical protein
MLQHKISSNMADLRTFSMSIRTLSEVAEEAAAAGGAWASTGVPVTHPLAPVDHLVASWYPTEEKKVKAKPAASAAASAAAGATTSSSRPSRATKSNCYACNHGGVVCSVCRSKGEG